jgi:3-hydroxyacyl-[acyl-carrier-protein] dehydratase
MPLATSSQPSSKSTLRGTFFFDPEDRIYAFHFPGHPVVPGSMIVHAFMLAAERLSISMGSCSMEGFRFKRFISPGEYSYTMEIVQDRLQCVLYDKDAIVTTGTLRL